MEELRRCVDRTIADHRHAIERGRPITPPNLRRLFERRWSVASAGLDPVVAEAARVTGIAMLASLSA